MLDQFEPLWKILELSPPWHTIWPQCATDRQTAASRIEPVPVHERATPHRGGGAVAVRPRSVPLMGFGRTRARPEGRSFWVVVAVLTEKEYTEPLSSSSLFGDTLVRLRHIDFKFLWSTALQYNRR